MFNLKIEKDTLSQTYKYPKNHKHKNPNISSSVLTEWADNLYIIPTEPIMMTDRFKNIKTDVTSLAKILTKYSQYLMSVNESMKKIHKSFEPVRSIDDGKSTFFEDKPGCILRSKLSVIATKHWRMA